jgi:hypothetical protein
MGDHTGKWGGRCRQLGGYAAGPEHGDFSGPNGHRIAELRFAQIEKLADTFAVTLDYLVDNTGKAAEIKDKANGPLLWLL